LRGGFSITQGHTLIMRPFA